MNTDHAGEKSGNSGGWLLPTLCIIMAVALAYLAYQNMALKRELADAAQHMHAAPMSASEASDDRPAHPFAALLPDGQEFTISTDSLDAPLLLLWLRSDCEECRQSLEAWNGIAETYSGQVWGIATRRLGGYGLFDQEYVGFPIVEPMSDSVLIWYEIDSTPAMLMIAEDGTIGKVWYGPPNEQTLSEIAALMKQPYIERR